MSNLQCYFLGHKYIFHPDKTVNSSSVCFCGGWKMLHDLGKEHKENGHGPIAGDCGNFKPLYAGYDICERCGIYGKTYINGKYGPEKVDADSIQTLLLAVK